MYTVKILRRDGWVPWTTAARRDLCEKMVKVALISNPKLKWIIEYVPAS